MRSFFTSITGFVLAGGESRRMGRPKALLPFGRELMIERQLRTLASVARKTAVVGWPEDLPIPSRLRRFSNVRWLPDEEPVKCSLAGIFSALNHSRFNFNLILACDMPFVEPELLEFLSHRAVASGADVTAPISPEGHLEGLCAVYKRGVIGEVRESLKARVYKTTDFFGRVKCEVISWRELSIAGFSRNVFLNINLPKDYENARRISSTSKPR